MRIAIGFLAVAATAAIAGYLLGSNRSNVSIYTGRAYSTEAQISITDGDGWVYDVPLDVSWTDAAGSWHEGSRPDCLPPSGQIASPVTFAATEVTVNGTTWRPVVWVRCDSAPAS